MIEIMNANTELGKKDYYIDSSYSLTIDASDLFVLPAMIDPHVHFRNPGQADKETWSSASKAALFGGITTVFDMPNNIPSCTTKHRLMDKKRIIDEELSRNKIAFRYHLYFGVTAKNIHSISSVKDDIIGLKVFMGSSTGDLLIADDATLEKVFATAKKYNLIIAIHAEDEQYIREKKKLLRSSDPEVHSLIRDPTCALIALRKALYFACMYQTTLYVLHVSTPEEVEEILEAKKKHPRLYIEATPHHLFLNSTYYKKHHTKVVVNPPLRSPERQQRLLQYFTQGCIDALGTDHAPHSLEDKQKPYPNTAAGLPGVESALPLLLNAWNEGTISLKRIIDVTSRNICKIFSLPLQEDLVLIDPRKTKVVRKMYSKAGFSPYEGKKLTGWPVMTICRGVPFMT
jgi:dihydroorotase